MKKVVLSILLLGCIASSIIAQTTNNDAAKRAMQMGHTVQQERVFLHFDNSVYFLGETIWFKAYISYGTNDRTSTPSKVLYVELVAPEGYVVETKKYKIDDNGCCNGEFELPELLLSGYYEVRAYTRYMLNWDKEAIFSRVFPIFDKVNGNNWDFKNMLERQRGYNYRGEWITSELPDADLKFYPEGGRLVSGLTSKVAYELRGNDGQYSNEEVTIFADNNPIIKTKPTHAGRGSFLITPRSGVKYRAEVTVKDKKNRDKNFKFDFPQINDYGVTLNIEEREQEFILTIHNNLTRNEEIALGILYRGALGYYKNFATAEKEKQFTLQKNELPEGVNNAVVFIGNNPLAERRFFVTHDSIQKNDRSTARLIVKGNNMNLDELSPAPHEKIKLEISRTDGSPIPATANLSLAVSDATGNVTTSYNYNLYSYLLLGSEIKGYIPNAAQYFDTSNSKRKEQLDLIMLTNGWTAYSWKELTSGENRNLQPIERGISLRGTFVRKIKNTKIGTKDLTTLQPQINNLVRFDISYNDKDISSYTLRTDSVGDFMIETDDFYGTRIAELIPQTAMKQSENSRYVFVLDRYFSPEFRLYDYWERNTGIPIDETEKEQERKNEMIQLNPFEYLLSSVEVVSDAPTTVNGRPPHSEMRFNYLDEWEYAQDVTYLKQLHTYEDNIYLENFNKSKEGIFEHSEEETTELTETGYNNLSIVERVETNEQIDQKTQPGSSTSPSGIINRISSDNYGTKYIGYVRYSNSRSDNFPASIEHEYTLTAADVVSSAMRRHNYNWAYWVQLMVVSGNYSSDSIPRPDNEYLYGKANAEKMINFKEFIIRSDIKTREQFENTFNFWTPKSQKLDKMFPYQKFYFGFLSQHYVSNEEGVDGFPMAHIFAERLDQNIEHGTAEPKNPNYVACFIPYSEQEKETGIIPDLANSFAKVRYTAIQGYAEKKEFYSPDYSRIAPAADEQDYRRTLLWAPAIKSDEKGNLQVEFYNNSSCNAINVSIAGRDENTYYSNDPTLLTRINTLGNNAISKQKTADEKTDEDYTNVKLDSVLEKACSKQHEKALIYYNQKRYKNAVVIWAELAKYKYSPALYHIAICYKEGTGLKENIEMAKKFYEEAAKHGNSKAQYETAMMYRNGTGCEKDSTLAHTWFRRAARQGEPHAMIEIAKYKLQNPTDENIAAACSLLTKAIEQNSPEGFYEYAMLMMQYPDIAKEQKHGSILDCMKKAAEQGHQEAQIHTMLHEDKNGNYPEAYRWAKELSQAKRHEGTKLMADYYYNGTGVRKDRQLAKDLYRTAANAGNSEAAKILKGL